MKYDIFISYSSHDQKAVEGLCAYLEQHKIRCFVAYRDIPRECESAYVVADAINDSRMMLVVFSDRFADSEQVDKEIEFAAQAKRPILMFRVAEGVLKSTLEGDSKNINWIDIFTNPDETFGYVVDNVVALLGMDAQSVVEDKTYRVGDYYDDGTKQGIVFEVSEDGKHGKIVSLDRGYLQWCTDKQCAKDIVVGAKSMENGKENTDVVMQRSDAAEYPAFQWCRDHGEDWYLPSSNELLTIRNANADIDKAMAEYGRLICDGRACWSSSEGVGMRADIVYLCGDTVCGNGPKDLYHYVRAVSTF